MARARIAALAAMLVVLLLGGVAGPPGAAAARRRARRRGRVAALDRAARRRGRDRRRVRVGRVRRADERVGDGDGPRRARGRLRHELGRHGDEEGVGWTTSAGSSSPGGTCCSRTRSGIYAASADVDVLGRLRGDRRARSSLRPTGGTPIDAVGWGDATNAFVEGTAVAAPAAGASIERRPGGSGGNVGRHERQRRGLRRQRGAGRPEPRVRAGARPVAHADARPVADATPTAAPLPTPSLDAVADAVADADRRPPTPTPTPDADPDADRPPSPDADRPSPDARLRPRRRPDAADPDARADAPRRPTPTPSADVPTPTPPTVAPSPSPSPDPVVRSRPRAPWPTGSTATIEGTLTTALGALESARSGFVQDATAGIALYLDAAFDVAAPGRARRSGRRAPSTRRFGQRTLRVAAADVAVTGSGALPAPLGAQTGAAAEPLEGLRLELVGTVTEAPSRAQRRARASRSTTASGPVRVIAGPAALGQLASGARRRRGRARPARPARQHGHRHRRATASTPRSPASSRSCRRRRRRPRPRPAPTPSPSPTVGPTPTVAPRRHRSPTPSPTPAPRPRPTPVGLAHARRRRSPSRPPGSVPIGTTVFVRGVVVAEAGRLGTPPLLAIADATGGIPVRLPDGVAPPARGTLLEVRGALADPYGQVELRPRRAAASPSSARRTPPSAIALSAGAVGEPTEGRLARVSGTIDGSASKSTSDDLTFSITGSDGATLRILADASAGLDAGLLRKGAAGQPHRHRRAAGVAQGRARRLPAVAPGSCRRRGHHPARADALGDAPRRPDAEAERRRLEASAHVRARRARARRPAGHRRGHAHGRARACSTPAAGGRSSRTAPPRSRSTSPRRTPRCGSGRGSGSRARSARPGARRACGRTRRGSWARASPAVHGLKSAPTAAVEWRLVRVAGTIVDVHSSGDRWTAELQIHGGRVPIAGLAGSGIASTDLAVGRAATVTGIVKRPYPTATDRRFAIVPRRRAGHRARQGRAGGRRVELARSRRHGWRR